MISNAPRLDLSGSDWQFKSAEGAWRKAVVPGNIHTDLMAAALLKDPHLGQNEADCAWVEGQDWLYRKEFQASASLLKCPQIHLIADGLDTYATLWINGRLLGKSQNSLVEHSWECRRLLKSGRNEIRIQLGAAPPKLAALQKRHGFLPAVVDAARVYARKAQYSFGWDWGPRLVTAGIFKGIRLEGQQRLRMADMRLQLSALSSKRAIGTIELELDCLAAHASALELSLGPWKIRKALKLKKGANLIRVPFSLENPRLWWPQGYGLPFLYNLLATLDSGESLSQAVGLKKVKLLRQKDSEGEGFGLEVNGVKIFCKGANWIPPDSFMGRVSESRVRRLVDMARQANMNMLRVWGGGYYESEAFYKACDELGILVWQDFPFACSEVPELPWFVSELKAEAEKAVRRLRRHVSLALWCGGNENHQARYEGWFGDTQAKKWGEILYHKVLPAICKRLDASTPYWPGSPFGGKNPNDPSRGDRHNWLVWASYKDFLSYREDKGRFISEFGFAALPNRAALEKAIPASERFIQSRSMEMHDKVGGEGAYARIASYINIHLPESHGFDDFRYLSQVMQSEALATGIEHWRRRQFSCSGALVWQLNDCWPVTGWSLMDSQDTPKLAWHGVRRAFDPLLLSAFEDLGPIRHDRSGKTPLHADAEGGECQAWLTHEWPSAVEGQLSVELLSAIGRGSRRRIYQGKIRVAPHSSSQVWSASRKALRIKDPSSQFLLLRFSAPGLERQALIYFERPRRLKLENPGLTLKAEADGELVFIRLKAQKLARCVELSASQAGQFSDNGFDLLPGEAREIVFSPADASQRARFSFKTLNEIALKRR